MSANTPVVKICEITRDMALEGKEVIIFGIVKDKIVRSKRDNPAEKYINLNIIDGTGTINLKIWDYDELTDKRVKVNTVVKVLAQVKLYKENVCLYLVKDKDRNMIRKAKAGEYDMSQFADTVPGIDLNALKKSFIETIAAFEMQHLKRLLWNVFNCDNISGDFFRYYAGKNVHHTYCGGLAKHSDETRASALLIARMNGMDERQQELVQAAAMLHDLGKLKELSAPPFVEITAEGRLYGHSYLGTKMVEGFIDSIRDFPQEDKHIILHSILSHHGKTENGAVIVPSIPEAVIVSEADHMSSQVELAIDFIRKDNSEGDVTDYCRFKKQFFVKEISFFKPDNQSWETA